MNPATIAKPSQSHIAKNGKQRRIASLLRTGAFLSVALFVCGAPQAVLANKNPSTLPAAVFSARTIYIDNRTSNAVLQNDATLGFAKWGHFQVVDSIEKADAVLRLTGTSYAQSVPSDTPPDMSMKSASTHGNTAASGASLLPSGDEAAPDGFTRLTLLDAKSGAAWWSDLSKTNRPEAAAHIVDGFREAFEQALKARGK
jgi:hypothetical protein